MKTQTPTDTSNFPKFGYVCTCGSPVVNPTVHNCKYVAADLFLH